MRRRRTQPIMYMPRDAKVNEAQPKTMEQILGEKIIALDAELAALKERYRWRRRNEEPAPNDETPIICLLKNDEIGCTWHAVIQGRFINQFEEPGKNTFFWRPLDLPEMGETK